MKKRSEKRVFFTFCLGSAIIKIIENGGKLASVIGAFNDRSGVGQPL